MKIKNILERGMEVLKETEVEEYKLKCRMLLANILGSSKEYLLIHGEEEIPKELENEFFLKIERVKKNEPIQYILNCQEFMGLEFYVDENVLIPQPDTEILVEEIIKISNKPKMKILDLCTGSGAIGISLYKLLKNAEVYASDISNEAINIAKKNANKNNVKIEFIKSDLFENFSKEYKFDIIVSNPPYIKTEVIQTLSEEVKREPVLALDGGRDGLKFYRKIIKESKNFLNPNGYLAFEIGYDQKEKVQNLFIENGYKNIYSKKDLSENDRIVIAQI